MFILLICFIVKGKIGRSGYHIFVQSLSSWFGAVVLDLILSVAGES